MVYSSVTNTQDRAFRKLKQAAAILGGNVVFIDNQSVEGNIYGAHHPHTVNRHHLSFHANGHCGVVQRYCDGTFQPTTRKTLGSNNKEPQIPPVYPADKIIVSGLKSFEFSNGLLYFNREMNEGVSKFIVTHFDYKQLTFAYKDKSRFVEIIFGRVKK